MKESDLLQYCHYYKGERENPYEGKEPGKSIFGSTSNVGLSLCLMIMINILPI